MLKMSRSTERKLIYAASAWQILTGFITTFVYSFYIKSQSNNFENVSYMEAKGIQSIFDSLYSFIITYGIFFIVIGTLNIIFVKRMLKDNTLQYKLPLIWIALSVIFYLLTDYISIMLSLIAAVVALAKNKAIKKHGDGSYVSKHRASYYISK